MTFTDLRFEPYFDFVEESFFSHRELLSSPFPTRLMRFLINNTGRFSFSPDLSLQQRGYLPENPRIALVQLRLPITHECLTRSMQNSKFLPSEQT